MPACHQVSLLWFHSKYDLLSHDGDVDFSGACGQPKTNFDSGCDSQMSIWYRSFLIQGFSRDWILHRFPHIKPDTTKFSKLWDIHWLEQLWQRDDDDCNFAKENVQHLKFAFNSMKLSCWEIRTLFDSSLEKLQACSMLMFQNLFLSHPLFWSVDTSVFRKVLDFILDCFLNFSRPPASQLRFAHQSQCQVKTLMMILKSKHVSSTRESMTFLMEINSLSSVSVKFAFIVSHCHYILKQVKTSWIEMEIACCNDHSNMKRRKTRIA